VPTKTKNTKKSQHIDIFMLFKTSIWSCTCRPVYFRHNVTQDLLKRMKTNQANHPVLQCIFTCMPFLYGCMGLPAIRHQQQSVRPVHHIFRCVHNDFAWV